MLLMSGNKELTRIDKKLSIMSKDLLPPKEIVEKILSKELTLLLNKMMLIKDQKKQKKYQPIKYNKLNKSWLKNRKFYQF